MILQLEKSNMSRKISIFEHLVSWAIFIFIFPVLTFWDKSFDGVWIIIIIIYI